MRSLVNRVALLLALMLVLTSTTATAVRGLTDAQKVRLFDPSRRARAVNLQRLNKLGEDRFNKAVTAYNEQIKKRPDQIDADKLADALAQMGLAVNDMFAVASHLDEVDP